MLRQHFEAHDRIDGLVKRAFQVTRPLLRLPSNRPAEHIGCCVLLKIDEQRFLLTAGHVLREFAAEPIYIAFDGQAPQAVGRAQRTETSKGLKSNEDLLDAAVMRLDDGSLIDRDTHFLTLRDVDVRDWMSPSKNYLFYGFPGTKTRVNLSKHEIRGENLSAICTRTPDAKIAPLGLSSDTHIVFDLDPAEMVSNSGIRSAPHPRGMSGCSVWSLPELEDRTSLRAGKLVGVFTDFKRAHRVGLASRVSWHLELIRHGWPELSTKLPAHGKLRVRFHDLEPARPTQL